VVNRVGGRRQRSAVVALNAPNQKRAELYRFDTQPLLPSSAFGC